MNSKQLAIIKKDLQGVVSNKRLLSVMLIVPIVMTLVLPSILVFTTVLLPDSLSDFDQLLKMLPAAEQGGSPTELVLGLMLNKVMPMFFLMIPIMASTVMAASSFVGEKEKHTLETLLYSPLTIKQLFQSKILASFFVGMGISLLSFVVMVIVLELEVLLLTGAGVILDISWIVIMLLIAPAISLVAISIMVRGSAKAQTVEEAQQRTVFLIFPILIFIVGQFTGVLLINTWMLLGLGVLLALLAVFLMRGSVEKFSYEKLLK